ncbi:MAG TPA: hypothetical protein VGQ83_07325 [Polyangia bacterium]|jgi:hypothetical protein
MLDILTFDDPRLVATLRTRAFLRAGVCVRAVASQAALLAAAEAHRPDAVLFVAPEDAPGPGAPAANGVRDWLGGRPVRLLLAIPAHHAARAADLALFDGLVALPEPERDLWRTLRPLLRPAAQATSRELVRVPATVWTAGGRLARGLAVEVDDARLGLLLEEAPDGDGPLSVLLHRDDGRHLLLPGRRLWTVRLDRGDRHRVYVAVRLTGASLDEVRALHDLALWEVAEDAGAIVLHGRLSAAVDLAPLARPLADVRAIDVGDVREVTRGGVLRWVELRRALPAGLRLRLRRVPGPFRRALRRWPALGRGCVLESYRILDECGSGDVAAEGPARAPGPPPARRRPRCGGPLPADAPDPPP